MVLCSGKGHGLNTQKKRKVMMKNTGLLYSKGPKYQSFKTIHQDTRLYSCDSVQDPETPTLLPPYHFLFCSLPLTLFNCFPLLPCSLLSLFFLSTCSTHGSAQCTAPPTPTGLLFKLSNLYFPNKKTLFFHATYSSWTTLMMQAETSSEMSVTMILTNQQSIIYHKT